MGIPSGILLVVNSKKCPLLSKKCPLLSVREGARAFTLILSLTFGVRTMKERGHGAQRVMVKNV